MLLIDGATAATTYGQEAARASPDRGEPLAVTAEGRALRAFLDGMAVELYWLRTRDRVHWQTGVPYEAEEGKLMQPLGKDETHCSAFVAAAAERLGIYILRPPDHSHILLANAQFDWLHTDTAKALGWRSLASPWEAQQCANRGEFVVVAAKNPDPKAAGHIAVIAPCEKPADQVAGEGPEICQAGFTNYRATSLQNGFLRHPGAWVPNAQGTARFFANSADPHRIGDVTWNP